MSEYGKYNDPKASYNVLKGMLENSLERQLTELEERKIKWLADGEYDTIGVFVDLFQELADKKPGASDSVKEIADLKNISHEKAIELVIERYADKVASDILKAQKAADRAGNQSEQ